MQVQLLGTQKKQTATITLDSKLIDATYAVTIGGVTVDDAKKTASVVATKEKVSKIDIVTASETLPLANGVVVDFKATNQYGETTDLTSSNFRLSCRRYYTCKCIGQAIAET